MCKNLRWGIEAAAVVALLVVPLGAAQENGENPPIVDASAIVTQAAQARPARRHQAQQLTRKDVVLGEARAQQPAQQAVDRAGGDPGVRNAVNGGGFRVALQAARFGEAMMDPLSQLAIQNHVKLAEAADLKK